MLALQLYFVVTAPIALWIGVSRAVVDTTPPRVIDCPKDIHRTVHAALGTGESTPVFWKNPRAIDNSGKADITSLTFSPGTPFPVGQFPNEYVFSDAAGNQAVCFFYIIITKAPFICPTQKVILESKMGSPLPQTVFSPGYPMAYPSNSSCQWEIQRSTSNSSSANGILFKINDIHVHANDVLVIKPIGTDERVVYSGRVPTRMLLYQWEQVSISLQTGIGGQGRVTGFTMEVEEMTDAESTCQNDYQCRKSEGSTGRVCIAKRYLCDHIMDCPHGDDELNCTGCQRNISLPFHVNFDPHNSTIPSNSSLFSGSDDGRFEWCFSASGGIQISVDFPPPGSDHVLLQSQLEVFGQDMVALSRYPITRSLSYHGAALVVRVYPGISGIETPFSVHVQDVQLKDFCETGFQCRDSEFCLERRNDCDGIMDCPLGDDEDKCERRCPKSCTCKAAFGSLNITHCTETWNSNLSKSAPAVTSKLEIALKNLGSIEAGFFEGLTNLEYLIITSSNVTNLEPGAFRGLQNLQILILLNNSLSVVHKDTFVDVPNLLELNLWGNKISDMNPDVFRKQTKMQKLLLQENQLTSLPSGLFRSQHDLKFLHIQRNNLNHLPQDIFEELKSLKYLDLMFNRLSHFPPGLLQVLENLEEIDISFNNLMELAGETLHGLRKLRKISVENNKLTHFEDGFFSNFTHLEGIYSRNNNIRFIQPTLFQGLVNLTCIDLKHNQLQELSFDSLQGLTRLTQLYLAGNQLPDIDPHLLKGLFNLDKLELQSNALTSLQPGHFEDLGNLTSLYLSNNSLTKMQRGTFKGLGSVYDLLLDSNGIEEVEPGTFNGLSAIGTLDLRFNKIMELKEGIFEGLANLRHLYLSGNPLHKVDKAVFDVLVHLKVVMTEDHSLCCFLNSSIFCDVNATSLPPYFTCDRRLLAQAVMKTFIWMQVVFAVSGNIIVLLWRGYQLCGHKKKSQALLIWNLAASDFLMGIYLLIIASADLYYGDDFLLQMGEWRASLTCKLAGVVGLVSSEASVFLVTLISMDRFMGVVFPFSRFRLTTRATVRVLVGSWVIALIVSITASALSAANADFYELSNVCLGLPLSTKPTNETTIESMSESSMGNVKVRQVEQSGNKPAWLFPIIIFLGVNLLSFLIIFACYLAIFISAHTSSKKSTRPSDKNEEMRLAIKMGLIVGTDFCCWVPVIIMGILSQSGIVKIEQTMYAWTVIFILPINSSINPWLYTLSTVLPPFLKKQRGRRGSSLDTGTSSASASKSRCSGPGPHKEKRSSSSGMFSLGYKEG